MYLPVL